MEITTIYWREDALNNLKDILMLYRRQGKRNTEKIIDEVAKDLENLKKRPYLGYIESALKKQSYKIFSYFITSKQIKVLYYTEKDTLYIVDFWDE